MAMLPAGSPSVLDSTPPSPEGGSPPASMTIRGASNPIFPAGMLPPEVLMTLMQSGEKMSQQIDLYAQMVPSAAAAFDIAKRSLQKALAQVIIASGTPGAVSQVSTGPNFPGASTPLGPSGNALLPNAIP